MKYTPLQALGWILVYLLLTIGPIVVAYAGPVPAARTFWIEFSVGLGFAGLAIMALQFLLTGRFKHIATSMGLDIMLQYHRQIGLVAFGFILAHPIILFLESPTYLSYLDPRVNWMRALSLSAAVAGLTVLIVTTLWRQALRIPYEWWRLGHGVIAFLVLLVAIAHILQVGFYVSPVWKQVLFILFTGGAVSLIVYTRVVKPMRMKKRPYRVAEVRAERGDAWTLSLEPDGHPGMRFVPGQFAWLTVGPSPFSLQQHPFSFSSSAENHDRVEFTIKELGDFTDSVSEIPVGTNAWLEGPYGAFTPPEHPGRGLFMIMGGVGITPILSFLRTFRDRHEMRPLKMIYGNVNLEGTLFYEELTALELALNFEVVHVIEKPPPAWRGDSGFITAEIISRHLPEKREEWDYYVCGPAPMMDLAEKSLRDLDIPLPLIYSERFNIV
jgi:predicted ferric reductase